MAVPLTGITVVGAHPLDDAPCPLLDAAWARDFYFEKIRVFKAGLCSDTLAWNNRIGHRFYFVGF